MTLDELSAQVNDATNAVAADAQAVGANTTALQNVVGPLISEISALQSQLAAALANNQAPTQAQLDKLSAFATTLTTVHSGLSTSAQALAQMAATLTAIQNPASPAPAPAAPPATPPTTP